MKCNPDPLAPHGFNRNASHNEGRYVCECESWSREEAVEKWWNSVNQNNYWSGCVQGVYWGELWDTAQEEIRIIFDAITTQ